MAKKKTKKSEKFEDLLENAEKIVNELESGELDLEKAIARYQEGITALKKCYDQLQQIEGKIQVLKCDDAGTVTLEPFAEPADD